VTMKDDEDAMLRSVALQNATSILIARQRAERRSEFYLAEGQRLAHMGSWAFNPGGFFEYWSPELFQIYGLDRARGAPTLHEYLVSVHPHDRDLVSETTETMLRGGSGCDLKHRIMRPDGELRHIRWVGVPVFEEEAVNGFVGTAVDVTEQEHLMQELGRREAYQAEAQRLSHTGSFGWRVSTGELLWSDETFRIFQYDRTTKPIMEHLLARVHPDDTALVKQALERALHQGNDLDFDHRLLLPDGCVKYVRVVAHASIDESGSIEFVGAAMDVTAAKEAEEELRQAQADLAHVNRVTTMGELTASLAHEVNQPIAAAVTNAQTCVRWLAGDIPNLDKARAAAMRIVEDGTRAADIINRIRQFFTKGAPQRESVDVNDLIREMIVLMRGEATRYAISVRTELAPDLAQVMGDRVQLQQVILNLIMNSIDAMKDVEGTRELIITSRRAEHDELLASVSDTGVGLPPQQADQIFNAFFTTKPQGTGMGLSISRSILESHGGRLWAADNTPRGARFCLTLPIAVEAHA
jgi:PAS domain S-box-containing protein